ncbi:MAG: 50S ribosomal protein L23 [Bacteroidetes bacterium]|nr:50S ribosomal protein L23 [Bacteroidota bacterium]
MKTILKRPLITEKYNAIAEKLNQFAFVVDKKATKGEIKAEIEKVYDVEVDQIRTMVYQGKTKTRYTRKGFVQGRKAGFKKAIVTVKDGGTIDFYSNL